MSSFCLLWNFLFEVNACCHFHWICCLVCCCMSNCCIIIIIHWFTVSFNPFEVYSYCEWIKSSSTIVLCSCNLIITNICLTKGLQQNNAYQIIDGFALYTRDVFCPIDFKEEEALICWAWKIYRLPTAKRSFSKTFPLTAGRGRSLRS